MSALALQVICPECGAEPGTQCVGRARPHLQRTAEALS